MNGNLDFAQKQFSPETPDGPSACQPRGRVDIRALKAFVFAKYPKDSAIYEVILTEQDFLGTSEFLAKVSVWLKLSRRIKS